MRKSRIHIGLCALSLGMFFCTETMFAASDNEERLENTVTTLKEILETPDKGIPHDLLDKAQCIVVVPSMKKGAFIVGAKYGKGYMSCRKKDGVGWTAPGTIRIEGGSFGFQIGGAEVDVVLAVMNESGAKKLLSSRFTLGADATIAAGPVGRTANADTDALMRAEILSWSRSHGVFAGISLQGATLRQDLSDNRELYGRPLENKDIVEQNVPVPAPAKNLIAMLNQDFPRKK
ncbi:MAG TPA: lipid-binding SYLF domain-containing protein [Acidobacteriota bacterium]|nr:lipid-binding SYLF domain-containing protein [Acidobacteriota bacterium]